MEKSRRSEKSRFDNRHRTTITEGAIQCGRCLRRAYVGRTTKSVAGSEAHVKRRSDLSHDSILLGTKKTF